MVPALVMTMNKLHLPVLVLTLNLILTTDGQSRQIEDLMDGMFGQFREVSLQSVWDEVQDRKTVSFSVVRDSAQFLLVNTAWITAGLLLWRGPAVTRREDTLQEQLQENISQDRVDFNKLNNFFTNPNVVARNLFVCTSLVTISRLFSSLTTITPL